jgi:hypothetical protein
MIKNLNDFKAELLSAIIETRTALLRAASQLSHEEQNTVFLGT